MTPAPDPQRDALTAMADRTIELTLSATLFAFTVLRGPPPGLTSEQVKDMALRYLETSGVATPYQVWKGKEVLGPHGVEEARQ